MLKITFGIISSFTLNMSLCNISSISVTLSCGLLWVRWWTFGFLRHGDTLSSNVLDLSFF
jgi:hypothetical protein